MSGEVKFYGLAILINDILSLNHPQQSHKSPNLMLEIKHSKQSLECNISNVNYITYQWSLTVSLESIQHKISTQVFSNNALMTCHCSSASPTDIKWWTVAMCSQQPSCKSSHITKCFYKSHDTKFGAWTLNISSRFFDCKF